MLVTCGLAALSASTVTPSLAAILENVSPETTVYVGGGGGGVTGTSSSTPDLSTANRSRISLRRNVIRLVSASMTSGPASRLLCRKNSWSLLVTCQNSGRVPSPSVQAYTAPVSLCRISLKGAPAFCASCLISAGMVVVR